MTMFKELSKADVSHVLTVLIFMVQTYLQNSLLIKNIHFYYRNILHKYYQLLSPLNSQIINSIWQLSILQVCCETWAIIAMNSYDLMFGSSISEQLWSMICNRDCSGAVIQINELLCIGIMLQSHILPIVLAYLQCFEIPCQETRLCIAYDCWTSPGWFKIVNTEKHCCDSQKISSKMNKLIAYIKHMLMLCSCPKPMIYAWPCVGKQSHSQQFPWSLLYWIMQVFHTHIHQTTT